MELLAGVTGGDSAALMPAPAAAPCCTRSAPAGKPAGSPTGDAAPGGENMAWVDFGADGSSSNPNGCRTVGPSLGLSGALASLLLSWAAV